MPTFNETLTNYQNAQAAIVTQEGIIRTSIEELIVHAQDAQDNGAGGESAGFMPIGDCFITRNGITFKVTIKTHPDTVTYPHGRVVGVEVNANAAPSFNL